MKANKIIFIAALALLSTGLCAQKYSRVIDKSVAVIGNEMIALSDLESEIQMMGSQGKNSDRRARCEILEELMQAKLFLMQARIDSLNVNSEMVRAELNQRLDRVRTALGGDEKVAEYFGKPVYKLRQEWSRQLEEMSLTQQEQQKIASGIIELTPIDVKQYLDTLDANEIPRIPAKYKMSQICVYPDREKAAMAVKEKLLSLRERILNGQRFSTLARLYSEDPGSAKKGGELGMASKSIFWPAFSDAAMSLKPGLISQIVETPDGFHIIQVIEKKGDMFNARHILMKPVYTDEDRQKGFARLDSLTNLMKTDSTFTFELAAQFFSQDPASRTNGGQMADPQTGSSFFEIDQLKPQDYQAIKDLKEGEISEPVESLDNEGRNGNTVYKVIRLDKIIPSHQATFEQDYSVLIQEAKMRKQHEAVENFITEKIKTTHIVIDPMFKDCQFRNAAWLQKSK